MLNHLPLEVLAEILENIVYFEDIITLLLVNKDLLYSIRELLRKISFSKDCLKVDFSKFPNLVDIRDITINTLDNLPILQKLKRAYLKTDKLNIGTLVEIFLDKWHEAKLDFINREVTFADKFGQIALKDRDISLISSGPAHYDSTAIVKKFTEYFRIHKLHTNLPFKYEIDQTLIDGGLKILISSMFPHMISKLFTHLKEYHIIFNIFNQTIFDCATRPLAQSLSLCPELEIFNTPILPIHLDSIYSTFPNLKEISIIKCPNPEEYILDIMTKFCKNYLRVNIWFSFETKHTSIRRDNILIDMFYYDTTKTCEF